MVEFKNVQVKGECDPSAVNHSMPLICMNQMELLIVLHMSDSCNSAMCLQEFNGAPRDFQSIFLHICMF